MTTTDASFEHRLDELLHEHRLTLRVLAITVEQLLRETEAEQVVISTEALAGAHKLSAWRDKATNDFILSVTP